MLHRQYLNKTNVYPNGNGERTNMYFGYKQVQTKTF